MAMTNAERKAKQRATPEGYAKSREADWRKQGIDKDMTYVEYLERLLEQNSQCSICGCHINGNSALDHNHDTGQARGLLCTSCNLMLGYVKDSSEFLLRAASYLAAWEAQASK